MNQGQQAQPYVIKPSSLKAFLKNFLIVIFISLGVVGLVALLDFLVGLDVFLIPLEMFNIEFNPQTFILNFVKAVGGLAFLLAFLNFFIVRASNVSFYNDRLVVKSNALLLLINSKTILYQNISNVTYEDMFPGTGKIILALSGGKDNKKELEFIDNPSQVASYIQSMLVRSKQMQQMQFAQQQRYGQIMNKY